ncbi:MAG: hypothetical protein IID43_02325 [Planctomycetes bacterium]|nr:hypothetical protein [Planctomycetota bacterium]
MRSLAEWLLDLDNVRLGRDAPLLLKFGADVPAWLLFGCALLGVIWIALIYRQERLPLGRRMVLASLRAAAVALVGAILCQPSLVLERNSVEPSHVVLLLDTSYSMAAKERYQDEALASCVARGAGLEDPTSLAEHTRLDLVTKALVDDNAAPLLTLIRRNGIQLSTFAGAVQTQAFAASQTSLGPLVDRIGALSADGQSTDLAGALISVIEHAQGRRLAAVILVSDGQTTEPTSLKDALDLARGRQVPILAIRFGSTRRPKDISVGPASCEETVFVRDLVAVEAPLSATGLAEPTAVTARLIEESTGKVVASQEVVLGPDATTATVEFRFRPMRTGRLRYRVEVLPLPGERTTTNNRVYVDVTALDDQLRVLLVEGYPRYEYRYLKNALLREETIELRVLLIDADRRFVQEGLDPIRSFPDTPEALSRYDVVLFGDVDPRGGWLSEAQMNMLLDFVGHEGGGFGLIAGERFAPHGFRGTPLEKLIPVRIDPNFLGRYDAPLAAGFRMQVNRQGRRSRLFRFSDPQKPEGDESVTPGGIFDALPELYWLARTLGPKPGASVLAQHPTMRALSGPMPVIVMGRYGAGRVFFQATDDTWRWRRHTGELLHDTYWVQVTRELMRGGRTGEDRRFVIRTDRRVYVYGSPVQTQVEVFDPGLLAPRAESIEITVTELSGQAGEPARQQALPSGTAPVAARFLLHRIGDDSDLFEGTFVPPRAGSFVLRADEIAGGPGERSPSIGVRIEQPDLEARRPEADHDVLQRIADATGGRVVDLDQLESAFGEIRDRSVQIPDDVVEPLWDSKVSLMLFVLLMTAEWGLRKVFGLL